MKKSVLFCLLTIWIILLLALSGCSLGQAATPAATETPTQMSVSAVMTSAAATAFVQLTAIASMPSPTAAPTRTSVLAAPTNASGTADSTQAPALQLLTPTSTELAGGLPVAPTDAATTPQPADSLPTNTPIPSLTPLSPVNPPKNATACLNSAYVADVTIADKTVLKPNEKFRKIWRIQNTGICNWDGGFGLIRWTGPAMGGESIFYSNDDQPVLPGGIVDIGIDMVAPEKAGEYIGHWVMISDSKITFGTDLIVYIIVAP